MFNINYYYFFTFSKNFFIFIDTSISFFQNKIFLYSKLANLNCVFKLQSLLISSLSVKFKAVQNFCKSTDFLVSTSFVFSSDDKFFVVCNLTSFSFDCDFFSFCFKKKSGYSLFFQYFSLYRSSLDYIFNVSVLPILETNSDKRSFAFRPYSDYGDFFLEIKSILSKSFFLGNFFVKNLNKLMNFSENFWLLKNFPLQKKILSSWISFLDLNNSSFREYSFQYSFNPMFFTLLNFLLNGLF